MLLIGERQYKMEKGGKWLAAVRSKIQWLRAGGNGSTVTWGSDEPILPALTAAEVEEIAAAAVEAATLELTKRIEWYNENQDMENMDRAIKEWQAKNRYMGCVAATNWFCKRVPDFKPLRLDRYTKDAELYQHVVASNGRIIVDLAPYSDRPKNS